MPKCRVCGKSMKASKEVMAGFSFSTRVWVCSCGYKRNLLNKDEHLEWEKSKKVENPTETNYNYIHCLDKPEINERGVKEKKEKCKCGGDCGGNCKCGSGGSKSGGCSKDDGCSGCK